MSLDKEDWDQLSAVTQECCRAIGTLTKPQLAVMRDKINADFEELRDQWQFTRRHYGAILAEIDRLEAQAGND